MYNQNSSVFIRIPFEVDDPADITQLTLNMMYDDGFMAYLNGQRIASANSQPLVSWSTAASAPPAAAAAQEAGARRHKSMMSTQSA